MNSGKQVIQKSICHHYHLLSTREEFPGRTQFAAPHFTRHWFDNYKHLSPGSWNPDKHMYWQHLISWNLRRFRETNIIIITRWKTSRRTKIKETMWICTIKELQVYNCDYEDFFFLKKIYSSINSSQMSNMTQKARMNNCGDLLVVSKRDPNLTCGIKYIFA